MTIAPSELKLDYAGFFGVQSHPARLDAILHECFARQASLSLGLGSTGVKVSVVTPPRQDLTLTVTGRWRSPMLAAKYRNTGALLLAPLVFLIDDLRLPHHCLFTLEHRHRSVADLFMRNLYYAACRGADMRFCTATHHADAATTRGSRDLARTYLQIVKTHSNDAVFDHIDAPELIVAATQIPLPILSNPLIKCGAADFRRIAARTSVKDEASEQSLAAPESIPKPALAAPQAPGKQATATSPELVRRDGLLAFPHYWQVPAATEMFAYQAIAALPPAHTFEYIGLPWATIIDGLRHDAASTGTILMALSRICEAPAAASKRVTVAQHIHAIRFIALFKACGITDLFWSHATHQQHEIDGIQLHPFPLFPAQTPDAIPPRDLDRSRRYLANFIGAYDPQLYLSNVREAIFNDPNAAADLLIVKRDAWHFDRAVYDEQIGGRRADPQCLLMERRHTQEYLNGIGNSWFTLCPSGAGPNSIRIFESLCLGSIPIVLTRDLRLPGPQALWEKAAIVEDDSAHGYARAIALARRLSRNQRLAMLESGQMLFRLIRPSAYGEFLHSAMADDGSR